MAELADLARKLSAVADGIESPRVVKAAGMAAKKAALGVAVDVAGGDRKLSGWGRRGMTLGAGFDQTGPGEVTVGLRPSGPWTVMERGRSGGKTIVPKRSAALSTPFGPRASVTQGAMGGKRAISRAADAAARDSSSAARTEMSQILREVF